MDTQQIGQLGTLVTVVGLGGIGYAICNEKIRNGRAAIAAMVMLAGGAMMAVGNGRLQLPHGVACKAKAVNCPSHK